MQPARIAEPLADVSWRGFRGYGVVPNVEFYAGKCRCQMCATGRQVLQRLTETPADQDFTIEFQEVA